MYKFPVGLLLAALVVGSLGCGAVPMTKEAKIAKLKKEMIVLIEKQTERYENDASAEEINAGQKLIKEHDAKVKAAGISKEEWDNAFEGDEEYAALQGRFVGATMAWAFKHGDEGLDFMNDK